MRRAARLLVIPTTLLGFLLGCAGDSTPYEDRRPRATETTEHVGFLSIEELYSDAPASFTKQEEWRQWEDEYQGRYVEGHGTFVGVSVHPQEGKLFFIVTASGEGGAVGNSATQVALLVEDAHTIALGEEEGSFLIDDTVWVNLGESCTFRGIVSGFSLFDTELSSALSSAGISDLVVVRVSWTDIVNE